MKALLQFIRRSPLLIYFIMAYAFASILSSLIAISPLYGIPGLFAPALAAIIVFWMSGGRVQVGRLLELLTMGRVNFIWLSLSFFLSPLKQGVSRRGFYE